MKLFFLLCVGFSLAIDVASARPLGEVTSGGAVSIEGIGIQICPPAGWQTVLAEGN